MYLDVDDDRRGGGREGSSSVSAEPPYHDGTTTLLRPRPITGEEFDSFWAEMKGVTLLNAFGSEGLPFDLPEVGLPLKNKVPVMIAAIDEKLRSCGPRINHDTLREFFDINKTPFQGSLELDSSLGPGFNVHNVLKDAPIRQSYHVVFLHLLRRYIPEKCEWMHL